MKPITNRLINLTQQAEENGGIDLMLSNQVSKEMWTQFDEV